MFHEKLSFRRAIFAVLLVGTLLPTSARTETSSSCVRNPSSMRAHFEVYPSGQKKLIAAAVKKACGHLSEIFDRIPSTLKFGADKSACTKDKVPAMDTDTAWQKCFGPPYILLSHNPRDKRGADWALLPEPSDFEFDNFKMQPDAACGKPVISCKGRTCDVKIPVDHLQVDMDMKVKSIYDRCYSAGLHDVKVDISSRPKRPAAYIEARFKFGDPDQLAKLVAGGSVMNVPPSVVTESSVVLTDDDSSPHPNGDRATPAERDAPLRVCDWVDPRIVESFKLFLDAKLDDAFDMSEVGKALMDQVVAPEIQSDVVDTLNTLDGVARDLVTPFNVPEIGDSVPPKPDETLELKYETQRWASTLDAIPGTLFFCFDCFNSSLQGPTLQYRGFQEQAKKSSDLAFEMNYLDANRLLEFMYGGGDPSKNRLDFCLLNGKITNCGQAEKSKGHFDQVEFLARPKMGWDDQGFYIDLPALRYTTNYGTLSSISPKSIFSARIHGRIVNNPLEKPSGSDSDSSFHFQATSTTLRDVNLSGGDVAGLASWIGQVLVNNLPLARNYAAKQIGAAVGPKIPIPDIGLGRIKIFPERQGLVFYGIVNDPSKIIPWFDPNTPLITDGGTSATPPSGGKVP